MKQNTPFLKAAQIKALLPKRGADSYKGQNGHVLIVAGSRGMSGTSLLSAWGALRVGAGLVTVAIIGSERSCVTHAIPEALTLPLPETPEGILNDHAAPLIEEYLEKRSITAVALGPGLGIGPSVQKLVKYVLKKWDLPLVLDADGLNNVTVDDLNDYPQLVITPHPMELSRLLRVERDVVKRERVRVAETTARDHQLICVLKGSHTVITDGKTTRLNPTGNPAMATGGMGDVLTGVIAGLLAQHLAPFEAACVGVYLHGLAGDEACVSDRGLLATEVAHAIPRALAKIGVK